MKPSLRQTPKAEKARYETHNNDVINPGYQKFVTPVVEAVLENFSKDHHGLDFGAGTGPVISCMLEKKGYNIVQFDPFFHNHRELLQRKYDYIVCCEVVEHFYHPAKEFKLLFDLLNDGGKLFCKTVLLDDTVDFPSWFYRNDKTHVFFYKASTMAWIKKHFGFTKVEINGRLIEFTR